jgi:undecaprenyl-diphosphatase
MMRLSRGRLRGALAALILWVMFFSLGFVLRGAAVPGTIDRYFATQTLGTLPNLAIRMTELGTLPSLFKIGLALLLVATFSLRWRWRILFSLGVLISVHFLSDLTKALFTRARPEHWIIIHETSYSYPSGHAATAIGFFALWAYFMMHETDLSPRPRAFIGWLCLLLSYGICWSRLALGAHWFTDVVGGGLLGLAVIVTGYTLFGDPAPPLENEEEADVEELHLAEMSESSL